MHRIPVDLRLPKDILDTFKRCSKRAGVQLNDFLNVLLVLAIEGIERKTAPKGRGKGGARRPRQRR